MKGKWGIAVVVVALWLCGALQQSLATRLTFWGFAPDFLIVALSCLALLSSRTGGAAIGFFAGAIYGAIDYANMTQYVVSRTLAGYLVSWSRELNLQSTGLVAAITTALTTLFTRLTLMFLAPPPLITPFLGATIRTAAYNGVLAVPAYLFLKRILSPPSR